MGRMGLFRTTIEIENLERRGNRRAMPDTLVDTGSEFTWVPRDVLQSLGIREQRQQAFIVADGRRVERDIGYALVHAGGTEAPDLVVFAEPGDLVLLGTHSLEGLNLKVDPVRKELVPAGPVIAASCSPFHGEVSPPSGGQARRGEEWRLCRDLFRPQCRGRIDPRRSPRGRVARRQRDRRDQDSNR